MPGWYVGADGGFHPISGTEAATARTIRLGNAAVPFPLVPTDGSGAAGAPPPSGGGGGGGVTDAVATAISALAQQLAASNEQAARDRANQLALQQAVANTQLGLQAQDTETALLQALANPRAAFMSQFMLRGNQQQGVPITPVLAGLLRRQNLPVSGNVPGAPLYMRPQDINFDALTQAFLGSSQPSINALAQDPIEREMLSGMAQLAGLNPAAFWNIRTPLPRSASLMPQFIRL